MNRLVSLVAAFKVIGVLPTGQVHVAPGDVRIPMP